MGSQHGGSSNKKEYILAAVIVEDMKLWALAGAIVFKI
jgi:hypothetical protein